jgi:hypothetical protein
MKRYRLLMNGRNFLININGTPKKHGFYQNIVLEADGPKQAALLASAKIWHDKQLQAVTLNSKNDPPMIHLHTLYELDVLDDVGDLDFGRTFYAEKKWWEFWKKNISVGRLPARSPKNL